MARIREVLWICILFQCLNLRVGAVAPVVFPPSQNWDGDDGQWSSFSLRLGNPEQVVRVLPSTSGYNVIVPVPEACNTTSDPTACASARAGIFDRTQSKTWQDQGFFGLGIQANLGYGEIDGYFGLDKVGLGIAVNPNVTFSNQVIGGIIADEFYIGTFGLGTQPTNFTTTSNPHTSFFTSLRDSNNTPSYTWSYTAGAKYQLTGVLSSLIFGGYDSSRFMPNNLSIPMSPDVSRDLVVGLQSISTTYATGSNLLLPSGGIFSFIDSTLPYIWLPVDACQAFERIFGLTWNETTELYPVNDTLHASLLKSDPKFTFTLGIGKSGGQTVDIVLPYASFDLVASTPLVSNSMRYFPLKRAANDTQYTLGRTFLQEAYLIADYERGNFSVSQCTFKAGATQNVVTIKSVADANSKPSSSSNHTKGLSPGIEAGVAVASAVVVTLLGVVFWMWRKQKWLFKKSAPPAREKDTESQRTDSTDHASDLMKKGVFEAMGAPLSEVQDATVPGTFAGGGRQEMTVHEPTANELASRSIERHEMFDDSVYREMPSSTVVQSRS